MIGHGAAAPGRGRGGAPGPGREPPAGLRGQEGTPRRRRGTALLAIAGGAAAAVAIAYHRVVLLGETFAARDNLTLVLPSRHHLGEALAAGRLPEWCDWIGLGVPFAANPINGVAYPPFWIAALADPIVASDALVLLHLVLAGIGSGLFARRLGASTWGAIAAASAFATCGYVASMPANNNVHLLCWIPWVAWAADRAAVPDGHDRAARVRATAWLAVAFALQLTVGEPAHVLSAAALALAIVVVRGRPRAAAVGRAAVAFAASLPLSAATLLPALAVVDWTSRGGGAEEGASVWALSPLRILELAWPGVLGPQVGPGSLSANLARGLADTFGAAGRLNGPSWSFGVFLGIPVLVLAARELAATRSGRWLALASLAFVALALGAATPLYPVVAALVPGASLVRYPEKLLVPALVLWTAYAGVGFGRLASAGPDRWTVRAALAGATGLGVTLALGWLLRAPIARAASARTQGSFFPVDGAAGVEASIRSGALAFAVALAFAALLVLAARLDRPRLASAAAALALGHLMWLAPGLNPSLPRAKIREAPPLLARAGLPRRGIPPPRVGVEERRPPWGDYETPADVGAFVMHGLSGNAAALFGLAAYPGTYSFEQAALLRLRRAQQAAMSGGNVPLGWRYALVGAEAVIVSSDFVPLFGLPTVAVDPWAGSSLLRVVGARPRAFVAPRWRHAPDPARELAAPGRLDLGLVVLEGRGDASPDEAAAEPIHACAASSERPESVLLDCSSSRGGYAVLLDAHAPGWSATVDGMPARIEAADGVFRAVRVGPGPHRIEMTYRTPWLRAGIAIAIAGWAAWAVVLIVARRKGRSAR